MGKLNHKDKVRELFDQNYLSLVEFSRRIVKIDDVARDIAQDAFVKLLERPEVLLHTITTPKSYLYTIVRNTSLNYLRKQKTEERYMAEQANTDYETELISDSLIYAEAIGILNSSIERLPASCREVFKLAYFEEKSNGEIADLCNVSINTVKTHKQRATKMLKQLLGVWYRATVIFFYFFY